MQIRTFARVQYDALLVLPPPTGSHLDSYGCEATGLAQEVHALVDRFPRVRISAQQNR